MGIRGAGFVTLAIVASVVHPAPASADSFDQSVPFAVNGSTYRTLLFCARTLDPQTILVETEAIEDDFGDLLEMVLTPSLPQAGQCTDPASPYPTYADVPVQVAKWSYGCKALVESVSTKWWFTGPYGASGPANTITFAQVRRATPPDPTLKRLKSTYKTEGPKVRVDFKQKERDCYHIARLKGFYRGVGGTSGQRRSLKGLWDRKGITLPVGTWRVQASFQLETNDYWYKTPPMKIDRVVRVKSYNRKCMSGAERKQIRLGMTLEEVRRIIGSNGHLDVRGAVTVRSWLGCGGSGDITVGFVGGRMASIVY